MSYLKDGIIYKISGEYVDGLPYIVQFNHNSLSSFALDINGDVWHICYKTEGVQRSVVVTKIDILQNIMSIHSTVELFDIREQKISSIDSNGALINTIIARESGALVFTNKELTFVDGQPNKIIKTTYAFILDSDGVVYYELYSRYYKMSNIPKIIDIAIALGYYLLLDVDGNLWHRSTFGGFRKAESPRIKQISGFICDYDGNILERKKNKYVTKYALPIPDIVWIDHWHSRDLVLTSNGDLFAIVTHGSEITITQIDSGVSALETQQSVRNNTKSSRSDAALHTA